jgi:subtilisin-like proprotein convertase family protein
MHRSLLLLVVVVAGLASLAAPAMAAAADTFSNTDGITINDGFCNPESPATPYPSQITVSGLVGTITDVNVTLSGLTHTFPDDVAVLLVGPGDETVVLMQDTGDGDPVSGVNLTFDDAATGPLPASSQIVSGTYLPTVGNEAGGCSDAFTAPAPQGPYGSSLSVFNGTDPNGTWSLYVVDDNEGDTGSISGWSLEITVPDAGQAIADLQEQVAGLGLSKGLTTALNSKLDEALEALDAEDTAGACDSLQAFLNQVNAQSGKKLTEEQADELTAAANEIRILLDC